MNKRKIAKFATNQTLISVTSTVITKIIFATVPAAAAYPKSTALTGAISGFILCDHFETQIDGVVDGVFDNIEARKIKTP